MKIAIDRKVFAQALSEVAPFAPAKPTIPVLKFAKITTKDKWMKIEANDTQNSMVKYIPMIDCDMDGTFLIDIADINKFVQKVKGDAIELEYDYNNVRIRHTKGVAEFQTQEVGEYPLFNMPDIESTDITIPSSMLADAIAKGKGFVASEQIRPMMTAIYAYTEKGDKFGYCATDTHKMIHGWYDMDKNDYPDVNWLIMPSVFSAIINACKQADTVTIKITASNVQYTIGSTRIQTVQAKGAYPNFRRVIPNEWNMECAVDKGDIMDALSRVSLFCDTTSCVKVDVTHMDMTLSVDNLDFMKSSKENITHNGCNGEIKIGVNGGYMADCASVFGGGDILIRLIDPSRPLLFAQAGNDKLLTLAMPLTITNV